MSDLRFQMTIDLRIVVFWPSFYASPHVVVTV